MIYANNLEVNYEVVKPEERTKKERAIEIYNNALDIMKTTSSDFVRGVAKQQAIEVVRLILRLPLIGSGRMQPENLSDLKYWKDVLSELEKM